MSEASRAVKTFIRSAGWGVVEDEIDMHRSDLMNANPKDVEGVQLALLRYQIMNDLALRLRAVAEEEDDNDL